MQNFERRYRKVVWFGGLYDFLVTVPFALPGLVAVHLASLEKAQDWLGLAGQFPILRIAKPEPLFGLADGIARITFASLMLYYLVVWAIPQIVWLFVVPEILFGVAQLGGYWLLRQSRCHLSA